LAAAIIEFFAGEGMLGLNGRKREPSEEQRLNSTASDRIVLCIAILLLGIASASAQTSTPPHTTWSAYLGGPDASHYSALSQINRSNVNQLEIAWSYKTGNERSYEFNPIIVGRTMYVVANHVSVIAIDATDGHELWVYHPSEVRPLETHRGINYWRSADGSDERLLITFNDRLHAINARTGKLIDSFGDHGLVDLRQGLGRDPESIHLIQTGTPGQVFEDLIILGSETGEEYGSPPGDIRAYDVRTGRMVWIFHTVPHPGEFGYDTWPKDAWKYSGGTNCWGEMSLDEQHGIVYIPLGAPTYDFYGADRTGVNLFADCLLALDARSGKLIWYYQLIHHDLWDYDATAAPQLLEVQHDGQSVPIIAEATKQGFVYVLNRVTGKPLWPIEERPVAKSSMPDEHSWPTQPFPTVPPPFARQSFTTADIDPYILSPRDREHWTSIVAHAVNRGLFTPPEQTDTVEFPGNRGGANWGSTGSDPTKGTLYVVSMDIPAILKNESRQAPSLWDLPNDGTPEHKGKAVYFNYCQRCHGETRAGAPPAIPSLVDAPSVFGEETIKSAVRYGRQDMPGYADLTDSLIQDLILFLKDPSKAPEAITPKPPIPPVPGQAAPPLRFWTGYNLLPSIIRPPWSTLTAYDLNTGAIKWQVPLGNAPQGASEKLTGAGIMLPRNGPVVTAGGLIFVATKDEGKLHAYDQETGKELWAGLLPAASEGVPSVYQVDGREYIVVCATSPRQTEIPRDGPTQATAEEVQRSYVAYALPKSLINTSKK
jgi:quinoprotein glucose dehydrogenase